MDFFFKICTMFGKIQVIHSLKPIYLLKFLKKIKLILGLKLKNNVYEKIVTGSICGFCRVLYQL